MSRGPRVEIWSDMEGAGGSRLAVVDQVLDMEVRQTVDGADEVSLGLPHGAPSWTDVRERRVVRLQDVDGDLGLPGGADAWEWRIRDVDEEITPAGEQTATLVGDGPWRDLATVDDLLHRVEANGEAFLEFEVLQQTPAEHLQIILGNTSPYVSGAPSYFGAGTVGFTAPVDMTYRNDNALSALTELLRRISDPAERSLTRQADGTYLVNVVERVGASANEVLLQVGRNVRQASRRRSTDRQATRVFPVGGGEPGSRAATMAENRWSISSISSSTVVLEDGNVLLEDGQLDGLYAEKPDGSLTEVTASRAPDEVDLADASGLSAGDGLTFRKNAAGDDLPYLERPSSVATYGIVPVHIERREVPPVNNLAPNAYLTEESGGLPADTALIGTASASPVTDPKFTRHGGKSWLVSGGAGDGIETTTIPIQPTQEHPYYTGQATLWVKAGALRISLVDVTNVKVWPPGEADDSEVTDELNRWIENLGIRPGEDFLDAGADQLKLQLLCVEEGTEFYLDAWQLTNTEGGAEAFYHQRASNALWKEANRHLSVYSEPLETASVNAVDLTRVDPSRWPDEPLELGADCRLSAPGAGIEVSTRIFGRTWKPLEDAVDRIQLEDERDRLSRQLARTERRRRKIRDPRGPQQQRPDNVTGFEGEFPDALLILRWNAARGAGRYEIREQGTGDNALQRWENGTVFANTDGTVVIDRDPDSSEFHLTIRALNPRTGRWSPQPTEVSITAEGSSSPCDNLVAYDDSPKDERCSGDVDADELIEAFRARDLGEVDLAVGDNVAWGWQGIITQTGGAGSGLGRTQQGLLFRDDFDRADSAEIGNGWTEVEEDFGDLSIQSQRVHHITEDDTDVYQRSDPAHPEADQGGFMAQCEFLNLGGGGATGITARRSDDLSTELIIAVMDDFGSGVRLRADTGGSTIFDITSGGTFTSGEVRLAVAPDGGGGYDYQGWGTDTPGNDPSKQAEELGVSQVPGGANYGGQMGWRESDHEYFWICDGTTVRVENLPAGWSAEIDSRGSVQEDGSGVVEFDVRGWALPASTVTIYDDTGTQQDTLTPSPGIYGGDVYEWGVSDDPDLHATVEMVFLDGADQEIGRAQPTGVTSESYRRGSSTAVIPGSTAKIRPEAWRRGSTPGSACVKELQVNKGRIACAFTEPSIGQCPNLMGVDAGGEQTADAGVDGVFYTYNEIFLSYAGFEPGDRVALGWIAREVTDEADGGLSVQFYDDTGNPNGTASHLRDDVEGTEQRYTASMVIPSGTASFEVRAEQSGSDGDGQIAIKKVQLNAGNDPCQYQEPKGLWFIEDVAIFVEVDTCAGGGGLNLEVRWDAAPWVTTQNDYEAEVEYYEDGDLLQRYTGVDPQAEFHSHDISTAGSDAPDAAAHELHAIVKVKRTVTVTFAGTTRTVDVIKIGAETPVWQETYGTC